MNIDIKINNKANSDVNRISPDQVIEWIKNKDWESIWVYVFPYGGKEGIFNLFDSIYLTGSIDAWNRMTEERQKMNESAGM